MARVNALRIVFLAGAVALAGGCGGNGGSSGGLGADSASSIAPASAPVLVSVTSDLDSEQWNTVEDLVEKFPGREQLLSELRSSFTEEGIDFEQDVKPVLGERVDLVLLDLENQNDFVIVTKAKDQDKMDALLEKGDDPPEHEVVDGWTVIADEQATIDRFQQAAEGEALEDTEAFKQATEELPDDTLATIFVNGRQATEALKEELSESGAAGALQQQKLEWVGVALEAVSNGVRLEGAAKASGTGEAIKNFTAKLLDDVPAGALAVVSFQGKGGADQLRKQLEANPALQGQLAQMEQFLGTTLDEVAEIFNGEGVLYVREASPFPEVTLLLEQADPARVVATLDKVAARAGAFLGARPVASSVDGIPVKNLALGQVTITYGGFDGKLALTNVGSALGDLREEGDKLADDPDFKAASETAGLPEESGGLVYVNLQEAIELGTRYAQLADGGDNIPPEVEANARPLQSFIMFASQEGDESHFTGFLEIE